MKSIPMKWGMFPNGNSQRQRRKEMLFLKRGLMAAGALALAAMLLNIVAPKAAHAIVATAVQVMNTSAAPVPNRDVDEAGRNAYTLQCATHTHDNCETNPVPSGYTFVLDSFSVSVTALASIPPTMAFIGLVTPGPPPPGPGLPPPYDSRFPDGDTALFIALSPPTVGVGGTATATGNLTSYATASTVITLAVWPHASLGEIRGVFSGHLVSTP
jgi:hypothetical protein